MREDSSAGVMDAGVARLAAASLRVCELFASAGLRYIEDADLTIAEACRRHHIDEQTIAAALADRGAASQSVTPLDGGLTAICRLVVCHHHGPLRASLGALRTCLASACGQNEGAAPGLVGSRRLLEALAESLLVHFAKEENILFPAFAALDEARRGNGPRPDLAFATVLHPIRAIEAEHDRIVRELGQLIDRVKRDDCGAPSGILQDCRSQLECFARDLTAHAGFENDFLFARGLALEEQGGWGW